MIYQYLRSIYSKSLSKLTPSGLTANSPSACLQFIYLANCTLLPSIFFLNSGVEIGVVGSKEFGL